jgi:hypothetical protein
MPPSTPETTVPPDRPAEECPYCGRPFPTAHLRDLHVGDVHGEQATEDERAAHDAATDEETDELFVFHLRVIAGIAVLYAVFVLVYMVVLSG